MSTRKSDGTGVYGVGVLQYFRSLSKHGRALSLQELFLCSSDSIVSDTPWGGKGGGGLVVMADKDIGNDAWKRP